jgi:hypothetical protein
MFEMVIRYVPMAEAMGEGERQKMKSGPFSSCETASPMPRYRFSLTI